MYVIFTYTVTSVFSRQVYENVVSKYLLLHSPSEFTLSSAIAEYSEGTWEPILRHFILVKIVRFFPRILETLHDK